jgi:triacylglycerol esterase/lipase EstA (alpha/beta hydrolase family)
VEIVATRVAPLPRTEWIKVAKQLPTKNFIDANLSVKVTLDWYFEAIERGLSELLAEAGGKSNMDDVEICVIGHSIGGWVARAYLGGLSGYV